MLNKCGFRGIHISPSVNDDEATKYSGKTRSRFCGPWRKKKNNILRRIPSRLLLWQRDLLFRLKQRPDNRKIIWIFDPEGGCGKSVFRDWLEQNYPDTGNPSVASFNINESKGLTKLITDCGERAVYVFNVPRTHKTEYMEEAYTVFEAIKDSQLQSTKYEGALLTLLRNAHVLVIANDMPESGRLTADRLELLIVRKLPGNNCRRLYPFCDTKFHYFPNYYKGLLSVTSCDRNVNKNKKFAHSSVNSIHYYIQYDVSTIVCVKPECYIDKKDYICFCSNVKT